MAVQCKTRQDKKNNDEPVIPPKWRFKQLKYNVQNCLITGNRYIGGFDLLYNSAVGLQMRFTKFYMNDKRPRMHVAVKHCYFMIGSTLVYRVCTGLKST